MVPNLLGEPHRETKHEEIELRSLRFNNPRRWGISGTGDATGGRHTDARKRRFHERVTRSWKGVQIEGHSGSKKYRDIL